MQQSSVVDYYLLRSHGKVETEENQTREQEDVVKFLLSFEPDFLSVQDETVVRSTTLRSHIYSSYTGAGIFRVSDRHFPFLRFCCSFLHTCFLEDEPRRSRSGTVSHPSYGPASLFTKQSETKCALRS